MKFHQENNNDDERIQQIANGGTRTCFHFPTPNCCMHLESFFCLKLCANYGIFGENSRAQNCHQHEQSFENVQLDLSVFLMQLKIKATLFTLAKAEMKQTFYRVATKAARL